MTLQIPSISLPGVRQGSLLVRTPDHHIIHHFRDTLWLQNCSNLVVITSKLEEMSECSFQHFVYNMERNKYRSYLHQLLFCWSKIEATLHEKGSSMKPIEWQAIWNMASPLMTHLNCHLAGWDTWLIFMAVFVNTAQGAGWRVWKKKHAKVCGVRMFRSMFCPHLSNYFEEGINMLHYVLLCSKNCWVLCSKKQLQIFEHFPLTFRFWGDEILKAQKALTGQAQRPSIESKN